MSSKRSHFVVVTVTSLVCLALLEACAAFIFKRSDMTNGKRLVLSAIATNDQFVGVKDSYVVPHPYLLYVTNPDYEQFGFTQINSLGYRSHEITRQKPANTYRIICLGGSTTFGYPYVRDPAQTWPSRLEMSLNSRYPDRNFEVLNAGLPYATSAELLAGYMFRHRYLEPDMVIIHSGGNDADPLMFENYNPEYTHFRAPGVRVFAGPIERLLLHSSIFQIYFMRYWRRVPSIYVGQPYELDHLPRDLALERVRETYPLGFERNIELIMRTALGDGAKILLVGFVSEPMDKLAKNWPWVEGLEPAITLGIDKNLRVMEALGSKYNTPYLSPSTAIFKDEWFVDGCHLNEEGEQAKADWILVGVTNILDGSP